MLPALEADTSVNTNPHLPSLEDYEAEENRRKDVQSLHKMANFFEKKVKKGEIIQAPPLKMQEPYSFHFVRLSVRPYFAVTR